MSAELSGNLPKPWLTDNEDKNAFHTRYGNFAITVRTELADKYPDIPMDILTVADNWYQLVNCRETPKNAFERQMAASGASTFGDMWQIMDRSESKELRTILKEIELGVNAGTVDRRIMSSIAVLDRTSIVNPVFAENYPLHIHPTEWGRMVGIIGLKTRIYHITEGYTRQIIKDLFGTSPDQDFSSALFLKE